MAISTRIGSISLADEVNGEHLGDQCCSVSINGLMNGPTLLWRKVNNEEKQAHQVVGLQVAWPKDLVVIPEKHVNTTTWYNLVLERMTID